MNKCILQAAKNTLQLEIDALHQARARLGEEFADAVDLILTGSGRLVVCGMGKSGLVGKKISATLSSTGTPSFFLHPAEALHGDLGMVTDQDVILLLSNSGETEEIVRLVPFLRRVGARLIAMVGKTDSSLAKMSDVVLSCFVEKEACPMNLAPTSSTIVTMALGDAIAAALIESRGFKEKDFARLHPSGSLGRKFLTVADLMHTGDKIPFAKGNLSLKDAVVEMSRKGFGALVIADEQQNLLGIFTDGDLRRFFEKASAIDLDILINRVMTVGPLHTSPDRLAMEALKTMEDRSITSLPVLQGEKVAGFLHLHDILRARLV